MDELDPPLLMVIFWVGCAGVETMQPVCGPPIPHEEKSSPLP